MDYYEENKVAFVGDGLGGHGLKVIVKASLQDFHGLLVVFDLASFVLANDHDACRKVGYPYGRLGFVDVLTACAARTESVDFEILFVYLNFNVLCLRKHGHRCG